MLKFNSEKFHALTLRIYFKNILSEEAESFVF